MRRNTIAQIAAATLLTVLAAGTAQAADEPFYKGKTITFICASAVGGGYDAYSRLIAGHISRHLDGNPSVVVQNMPGAGSIRAAQGPRWARSTWGIIRP